ncbi:uncharacterized protein JCM10292_002461, partial [Rhodotorula paludigena]|uniref:uncharacterized protein n=1 Tax=Rhodotorula paludigena TaxID=86838 RepID=UPI0031772BDE
GRSASVATQGGTSSSRVRGSSSASSAGRGRPGVAGGAAGAGPSSAEGTLTPGGSVAGREQWPADALAEVQRLKTKISELTFLNGLMQSRLAQLEGPGRVPRHVMTSLTAETPRPDPDEMMFDEDDEMDRPEPIEEEVPAGFE